MMTDKSQKGEHKIVRFFEGQDIKYLYREKKIDLSKDAQQYILLDFYLPDFKLYVDFLSGWEDPKQRPRLLGRIDRCTRHGIPCVFVYPKDLDHLDAVLPKKLAELNAIQRNRQQQKKANTFNNLFAICSMITGVIFALFSYTRILGYIALAYGIVLFLLCNHDHLGKGTVLFFTYLWLIIRAAGKGLFWGMLHIGTVLRYAGKAIAFIAINIGIGLKKTGILLWKLFRWLALWFFYLARFLFRLLWKYVGIAVKGLQILLRALFKGTGKGAKATGSTLTRFLHGLRKAVISIVALIISIIMIPIELFMKGPGKVIQKKYTFYRRKIQLRMQHRRFGKF